MAKRVVGYIELTFKFEREGNKWVGTCLQLGTSTFARTLKRCDEELSELVIEHLNVLDEAGERSNFFLKWGIEIQKGASASREVTIKDTITSQEKLFGHHAEPSPLYRPTLFPIGRTKKKEPVLAGA